MSQDSPSETTTSPETTPFKEAPDESVSPSRDAGAVEVLPLENKNLEEEVTLQVNSKNSWLPWKRPNRRDQQLRHLREGYIELLGLVRSISHHLDRQKEENSQVTTLVESLPPALNSFEKLASSQQEVTAILGNLNSHMEKTHEKDEQLLENLSGVNSTLQDVSSSHEKSLGALGKVSERIEHSDEQMKMLFEQANRNNEAAGSLMIRLEKRVFLSNMALVVLLCMILFVAVFWLALKQDAAPVTVVTAAPVPSMQAAPSQMQAPAPAREVFEGAALSPVTEASSSNFPEYEAESEAASDPESDPESETESPADSSEPDPILEGLDLFEYP